MEFCRFVDDAWMDGYDFRTFTYSPELESTCHKYLQSEAYWRLFAHPDQALLKISDVMQLLLARFWTIPLEKSLIDPVFEQQMTKLYGIHSQQMKFSNFCKLDTTKFFLFQGESWNTKAFLSLISDQFKWDLVPPSSMVLLEIYEDDIVNSTEVSASVKVKYNDQPI